MTLWVLMKHLIWQKKPIVTKIVFSKKATNNLIEQALFIFEQSKNVELSDKYLNETKQFIIEILTDFPKSGRPSDNLYPQTRKLVYKGYSIIYRTAHKHIKILTLYRENIFK